MSKLQHSSVDPSMVILTTVQTPKQRKDVVAIRDHQILAYTYNIVVRYVDNRISHYVDYWTYVDDVKAPNHDEMRDRLYATLGVLGTDTAEYTLHEVMYTDDF